MFTDDEIFLSLKKNKWNAVKVAYDLSELKNVEVSPQLVRYWAKSFDEYGSIKKEPKILIFDIETSPITAYVWGLFKQNISIDAIVDDWYVISWSAKWLGKKEIISSWSPTRHDELVTISELWDMLDEADIVVAHNGKKFDVKKINAKFFEYDIGLPSYYKVVDTLQIAKGNFAFTSNKLDYITKLKGNDGKHKTDFQLWKDCMDGDLEALDKMVAYCEQDVLELEKIYLELRAWDSSHPSWNSYTGGQTNVCNSCGSEHLVPDGHYRTGVSTFEIYRCESCGHLQRGRENVAKGEERQVNIR